VLTTKDGQEIDVIQPRAEERAKVASATSLTGEVSTTMQRRRCDPEVRERTRRAPRRNDEDRYRAVSGRERIKRAGRPRDG